MGETVAPVLRRAEVLDLILRQMRQEVMAPRMMQTILNALLQALGGAGAAVLAIGHADGASPALHESGQPMGPALPALLDRLRAHGTEPVVEVLPCGIQALSCRASTRFGQVASLAVWRPGTERLWDGEDRQLLAAIAGLVRIVLEHEAIQQEMARHARTDPLTGLMNRRAFLEEAERRIDRLDRDGLPGTLVAINLDRFKPLNDRLGHEAGDAALVMTGALLRNTVRPLDLVARFGGDEFALWMDGSDHMTAAERAEDLRLAYPGHIAHLAAAGEAGMSLSIGIACRDPGHGEELEALVQRADQAMRAVKHAGGGHWLVSNGGGSLSVRP